MQGYMAKMISGAAKRRAKIAALHTKGVSMAEIAKKYGVTRQRIYAILNGNGAGR